jgi:cardiolipin synthase
MSAVFSITAISTAQASRLNTGFYNNASGSPLLPLLQSAKKQIDIEVYQMEDTTIIDTLRAALKIGIKVRIIQEPTPFEKGSCLVFTAASARDNAACADEKQLVKDVIRAGGSYVAFNKDLCGSGATNCFEHGKMAIVDEQTALISTGNYNATNLCDLAANPSVCNRDYTYAVNSPNLIYALESIFQNDLIGTPYNLPSILSQYAVADTLVVSPYSMQPMVDFINSAQSSIQLQNQYVDDPTLVSALAAAAQRGVIVQVMVTSLCAFGTPHPNDLQYATSIFNQLDAAGVQSRFFSSSIAIDGKPGYLHAKAIIVDGNRAWLGSVNGSTTAITKNREFSLFFNAPGDVVALSQIMSADFGSAGSEDFNESANCVKDNATAGSPQD